MLIKNFGKAFFATTATISICLNTNQFAQAASFYFGVDSSSGEYGYGNLEGIDANGNNLLEENELTSFYFNSPDFGHEFTLESLFSFGSISLNPLEWNANASNAILPTGSYFSWKNGASHISPGWATIRWTDVSLDESPYLDETVSWDEERVPEPATLLGLLAVGALGATSLKHKPQETN
ncbi:MAG: PEP-CTERM sorting domain-containing protein [Chroococcales cyanobacterium]